MSPKSKERPPKRKRTPPRDTPASDPARKTTFLGRDGLGAYIQSPESFPSTRVIYSNDQFVIIKDLFPKASIHLLLLPRDPIKTLLHPFLAFEDASFLASVKEELSRVRSLAAKELKRRFGAESARERAREAAIDSNTPDGELPLGRDWAADIISGVHAVPSMNHLHVHVLSRDRHSQCLKHATHYNSFTTDFMVPIEAFPLDKTDRRRHPGAEGYLKRGLRCWQCDHDFGRKFSKLKLHLEAEYNEWKQQ